MNFFRTTDTTDKTIWKPGFSFFINDAYICTCIRHVKETIPSSSITWSEMVKQNIQAKEVYCGLLSYDGYLTLAQIFLFDWPTDFAPQFF